MRKKILVILMAFSLALFSSLNFAAAQEQKQEQKTEKEWLDQLAKDLAELAKTILEANDLLRQMTPEEQKEVIEKFTEEIIKLQKENPDIRIKISPSK